MENRQGTSNHFKLFPRKFLLSLQLPAKQRHADLGTTSEVFSNFVGYQIKRLVRKCAKSGLVTSVFLVFSHFPSEVLLVRQGKANYTFVILPI